MKPLKDQLRGVARQVRARPAPAPAPVTPPEPDFRTLFGDVTPLRTPARFHPAPAPASPWPRKQRQDPDAPPALAISLDFAPADDETSHVRPGMPHPTLRRLAARHWPVGAEIDLHGMDRHAALDALTLFLHTVRQRGRGPCVRVIHGKGFGSGGNPVLRHMVRAWLRQHPDVLAFCPARERDGGSGALLVLLKKQREEDD